MATNTAASFTNHTGNGSAGPFNISFSYLAESEIDVTVGGVLKTITTHYTFNSPTQITFTSGNHPSNGVAIKFQRDTDISAKKIDFQDGSVLTEADLDTQSDQILFGLQEFVDIVNNDTFKRDGSQTLTGSLVFEGSSDDANETTLSVTNPTADRTITFPDVSGAVVTTGDTGSVTSTMITDGTIVDGDVNASANIAGTKINPSFGSQNIITTGNATLGGSLQVGTASGGTFDITTGGAFTANGGTISKIQIGVTDDREIDTTSGNLTIDSDGGTTTIDDILIISGTTTIPNITGSAVVTSGTSSSDTKVYSAKRAEERFYGKDTLGEIQSGETWSSTDDKVATTAAIDARVIDLVDDVGGFVPIATELAFPNANPDINNGAGTLVSIQALSTAYTSNGSGQFTISNGTVGNSTVTINGATASTTFAAGFGMILETTTTLNTYTFHRLVPKATEVTTVAGSISNVNTVAGAISNVNSVAGSISNVNSVAGNASNINSAVSNASNINAAVSNASNINTVAGINANVTTVAGISSNVTTVANDATDIGNVSGSIANVNTTAGSISNVNTVAGSISNVNTVAGNNTNINTVAGISGNVTTVAGISSNVTTVANDGTDIGLVAGSISNVNTTAGSIDNVNTTAGSISNVNTVATNITNVNNASTYLNNFLALYLGQASSDPTQDALGASVTEGDLYFNSVSKQLRVFNGQVFQGIAENTVEVAKFATAAFNALYTASAGSNSIDLGGLAITGAVFSNEAIAANRVSLTKGSGTFNLGGI